MRDRLRREQQDPRARAARAPVVHPPDVAAVLRLQALAGNAATSRLLSRDAKAPAQERTIVIDGMGAFPVLSLQVVQDRTLSVTLPDGPAGPQLLRAAREGTPLGHVTISMSGRTLALDDALVTSFQQSGGGGEPTIAVQLQGAALHVQ